MRETEEKQDHGRRERTLADISATVWLTPDNAGFFTEHNFLYVRHRDESVRAFLCRQFPFELEWEFISVMNEAGEEIGIIRSLDVFGETEQKLLKDELSRRYYAPVIKRILSAKERYGFSYWRVETKDGEVSFTLHDTYRSIIRAGETRIIMLDVNGNRFEIPDTGALDRKSYKKIELYM